MTYDPAADTVRVSRHALWRLLLMFRDLTERGSQRVWVHNVDYDISFERLADILDEANAQLGTKPDPRTRCKHGEPVYEWPSACVARWTNVRAGRALNPELGGKLSHLASADGMHSYRALCGFTFADEDVAKRPAQDYPRCATCERELQLCGNVTVAGKQR
jgi:hypothetical protein